MTASTMPSTHETNTNISPTAHQGWKNSGMITAHVQKPTLPATSMIISNRVGFGMVATWPILPENTGPTSDPRWNLKVKSPYSAHM